MCLAAVGENLLFHQALQCLLLAGEADGVVNLGLELAGNQGGAPAEHVFGDVDVTVEVVADVQRLPAGDTEALFHQAGIAPEVNMARLQRPVMGMEQRLLLIDHPVDRGRLGEEARLVGRDDHHVEEVAPGVALRTEPIQAIGHHLPGV